MTTRRRIITTQSDSNPNILQQTSQRDRRRSYNNNDSDESDFELAIPLEARIAASKNQFFTQGFIFITLFCVMGIIIYSMNSVSQKQLAKIREEYAEKQALDREPSPLWWNHALMYYIYVRSFHDSDADGIGDINGIREKLDYLTYLGVEAVILSPVHKSPMVDLGRDVSDFYAVDPTYGSLDDFKKLIKELHAKGIKIVLEFIPNHTSLRHEWFQKSRKLDGDAFYRDFYVWHPGRKYSNGTRIPPNNWKCKYGGGTAWTFDSERQEYYYHYYHRSMPDLNHRHPQLRHELINIFKYWLDLGVDGFRLDGVRYFFEVDDFDLNEPDDETERARHDIFGSVDHIYTEDQPDIHEFMASWREFIDSYAPEDKRLLGIAAHGAHMKDLIHYYITGADIPFCDLLYYMDSRCDTRCIHTHLEAWLSGFPEGRHTLWQMSSSEIGRHSNRQGSQYGGLMQMLLLLLPGSAVGYYGDELGMTHHQLSYQETKDVWAHELGKEAYDTVNRDPGRTPMLWNSAPNAGFTKAEKPWLPVHPKYQELSVKAQKSDKKQSNLQAFRKLVKKKKVPTATLR